MLPQSALSIGSLLQIINEHSVTLVSCYCCECSVCVYPTQCPTSCKFYSPKTNNSLNYFIVNNQTKNLQINLPNIEPKFSWPNDFGMRLVYEMNSILPEEIWDIST